MKSIVPTYESRAFRDEYIRQDPQLDLLFKPAFEHFFVVRTEHVFSLVKFPVPPCRETSHACLFVQQGIAEMRVGQHTYQVHPNQALFIAAGQIFSFETIDPDLQGYYLHFHDQFLLGDAIQPTLLQTFDFLQPWGHPHHPLSPDQATHILPLFGRIYQEYSTQGVQNQQLIRAYLLALLSEFQLVAATSTHPPLDATQAITQKFKALLYTQLGHLHRVSDYAALLCISPNYLHKCVKASTGKAPIRWIDEAIVLQAKALLLQSEHTVSEIAHALGIQDHSYFSRMFRRQTGLSPLAYRKSLKKSPSIPDPS